MMVRTVTRASQAAAALCVMEKVGDPLEAIYRAVHRVLADAGETGPKTDLAVLGSLRNVRKVERVEMVEAGRLVRQGGAYLIQVNQRHGESRRRFTGGHEICHTFFNEALGSHQSSTDRVTGLFEEWRQEKFLCAVGPGHMLLRPSWLLRLTQDGSPSLDRLIEIHEACGGAIEATALQIARLGAWDCTFVSWRAGLRETQKIPPEQQLLTGLEAVARGPREKLQARKIHAAPGLPYLPRNKSVDEDTLIYQAFADGTRTEGHDEVDLGRRPRRAWCQSE